MNVFFGLIISIIVLFLLTVFLMVVKDIVVSKYGEDVGLSMLIAGLSVLLILLSAMSNR